MIPFISTLRSSTVDGRVRAIEERYAKNRAFFSRHYPAVDAFLERTSCPYSLELTDGFLDIRDTRTDEPVAPAGRLDAFSELLGDWTHTTWVELIDLEILANEKYPLHFNQINRFYASLTGAFPGYRQRLDSGRLFLRTIADEPERRFSPPVIFLGIFHGLHIDYFLSRTDLANILLVEPEAERFEVSCYFLDYEEIHRRFGKLLLSIGSQTATQAIKNFFNFDRVTPQVWTRVLPAYASDRLTNFIEAFQTHQAAGTKIFFPIDIEQDGLLNTHANLQKRLPILGRNPRLSKNARIAIIASGPSLDNDIGWLKTNAANLILFAVHSAVPVLRTHGIRPDFQFSIEAKPESETVRGALMEDVPLVAYCRADASWSKVVARVLLVSEHSKAQSVQFLFPLKCTHPSTANLALSLASFCAPREIYLLGCDFGFRNPVRHHASQSLWEPIMQRGDSGDSSYTKGTCEAGLEPNFPDAGRIMNQPFLEQARLMAEQLVQSEPQAVVYNLSDGARVGGTVPLRSSAACIGRYREKKADVKRILDSFSAPAEGENFNYYPLPGAELLGRYLENIFADLTMETFSWRRFADALDNRVLDKRLNHFSYNPTDWRMDIYGRLLNDLFRIWYRVMLFTETEQDAERLYRTGLGLLREIAASLEWPSRLDERGAPPGDLD